MSLELQVYAPSFSDELIPRLEKRLNDFGMIVEIKPGFTFSKPSGSLSFKFQLMDTPYKSLLNRELVSNIDVDTDDFDLLPIKAQLNPKKSLISSLFSKKIPEVPYASPELDKRLLNCKKVVTITWHSGDTFEFYFASLSCAILAELTDGVSSYPADGIWYERSNVVGNAWQEIKSYNGLFTEDKIHYNEFAGW
jgi:hypothetical protein